LTAVPSIEVAGVPAAIEWTLEKHCESKMETASKEMYNESHHDGG
jgi:hypothetical protein